MERFYFILFFLQMQWGDNWSSSTSLPYWRFGPLSFSLFRILWVMPKTGSDNILERIFFPSPKSPAPVGACRHFLLMCFYCISSLGLGDFCIWWRLWTVGCVSWFYIEAKAFELLVDEGGSFLWLAERRQGLAHVLLLGK